MLRVDEWRLKMSETATKVLAKLQGAGDKTAARFTRLQDRISSMGAQMPKSIGAGVSGALGKLRGLGGGVSTMVGNLAGEIGGMGGGITSMFGGIGGSIGALAGPIGIVAIAIGGVGLALTKGIAAAEAYGVPFRELRNLNLDKTKEELDAVNDRVLALSFDKGLDPTKLIAGVYDIQSTIGQFGPAVENMVADVGVASRALNMDFAKSVAGVGKALVQFKLPLTDVNRLLESNAKTVQVGVVTFDELSQVQTEFAGAAASANQQLDTANKVFALLTTNTKNADIAATYAKSAFQDLGKVDTAKALKKIGVNVFDANKNMRQTDDILRDLVPKLGTMSDQTFAALKEEIGGSEGLRALMDMTKASGGEVLRVLNAFDDTKFSLADAIKGANGDLDVISDKITNKLGSAWVELGQYVMPFWIEVKNAIADVIFGVIDWMRTLKEAGAWMKDLYDKSLLVRMAVQGILAAGKMLVVGFKVIVQNIMLMIMTPIKAIGHILKGEFSEAFKVAADGGKEVFTNLVGGAKDMGVAVADGFGSAFNPKLDAVPVQVTPVMGDVPAVAQQNRTAQQVAAASPVVPQRAVQEAQGARVAVERGQGAMPATAGTVMPPVNVNVMPAPVVTGPAPQGVAIPNAAHPDLQRKLIAPALQARLDANAKAKQGTVQQQLANAAGPKEDPYAKLFAGKGKSDADGGHSADTVRQGITEVAGGGQQVRNVNITIGKLVERIEVHSTTAGEGISNGEIQRRVEEALIKAVRGSEAAVANA